MIQHTRFAHTLGSIALGAVLVLSAGSAFAQQSAPTGPVMKASAASAKSDALKNKEKKDAILAVSSKTKSQKTKTAGPVVVTSKPTTKSKTPVPPVVKTPAVRTKSKTPVAGPVAEAPPVLVSGSKSKASAATTKTSAGGGAVKTKAGGAAVKTKAGDAAVKTKAGDAAAKTPTNTGTLATVSTKQKATPTTKIPTIQVKSKVASAPMKVATKSTGSMKKGFVGLGASPKGAKIGSKVPFKPTISLKKPVQGKVGLPHLLFVKQGGRQGAGRFPAAHAVPELDARGARTAIALLLGFGLLLASRRRQPGTVA